MPVEWVIILVIVGVIVLATLFVYLFAVTMYNKSFKRRKIKGDIYNSLDNSVNGPWGPFIPYIKEKIHFLDDLKLEDVNIKTFDGLNLHASYYPAKIKTNKVVISVHGYMGYRFQDYAITCPFYHEEGYNILMIDLRGHGQSDGDCVGFGVLDHKDLIEWIKYINNRFNNDCEIILHGVSMGGNTVLMTADKLPTKNVKAIIADCGFDSAWNEIVHVCKTSLHLPAFPLVNMLNLIVKHRAKYNLKDGSVEATVNRAQCPICFIHGGIDNFVPTIMSKKNHEACTSEKELHIFDNASHALSYLLNKEEYQKIVISFLNKHCV